jgi:hypothetical protein
MFREAIPHPVWRLLPGLIGLNSIQSAYLAGGTALAFQLGHRVSADLDFFSSQNPPYTALLDEMRERGMNAAPLSSSREDPCFE